MSASMTQQTNHHSGTANSARCVVLDTASYCLLIKGDSLPFSAEERSVLIAESPEEACDFQRLLGDACQPFLSQEYRRLHPGLYEKLEAIAVSGLGIEAPLGIDTAARLMKKLPLDLNRLFNSPIALSQEDPLPAPIRKNLVHKHDEANVLVSEPFTTGWLRYFNIFSETTELKFDHHSAHVQGMLILEALRQAGIASAHCQGLPLDGKLALLNYNTNFYFFLERDSPVTCRTYCSFTANETSEDKEACIYIQVFQWGRVCADAVLKAFACINSQRCEQKEQRLKKITERQRKNFDLKIKKIHESMLSTPCE
jgi:hypothetical protein